MHPVARSFLATLAASGALLAAAPATGTKSTVRPQPAVKIDVAGFEKNVQPLLTKTCLPCHNDNLASGSVNLAPFSSPSTVTDERLAWEKILQKIRTGEMPPKGVSRPPQPQIDALTNFVQSEFDKADQAIPPDPGRVTARRLNRKEYTNTIRDLLAVDFRAEKDFPTDDSGYGFDNIGDILTISPILMEKYLDAAEVIASRALGANPLPNKPYEVQYHAKDKRIQRPDFSHIEASHRVDFDGEYVIRFGLPGERSADAKPVTMGFWMDGGLLKTIQVETKPSGLVYFNPYSEEEMRLVLTEGDHVFRAGFIDDDFVKGMTEKQAYNKKTNKYLESITFVGPFPAKVEKASRKKILICDPKTGQACVEKIIANLAHHAYRRPVTKPEVAGLMKFVSAGKAEGQSVEQGIQLAIEAMLVSPNFLFRMERDPDPTDATRVHKISDLELASRLSYFLWSSMPDDELLSLAEAAKLRSPGALDAQVKRMLADPRSSAFSENFAGQWLETRNLDIANPDPKLFKQWGPELRDAMKTETRMFFDYILRENRPISDFIDADYTFLNERLAKHYGIAGVAGPDFRKVELTGNQRGGVLTQASVLTVSSYPTRTSPTIRGKYILNNILGTPPPPPPPDVPALDASKVGSEVSLRKQLEEHRGNPACSSCHNRMDVLGFGLENYDALGRWRTKDGKFPIDVSGTLPNGKSFKDAGEMREILKAQLPDVSRCLTEKMLTYALGRGVERYDNRTIEGINRKLADSGYQFQTLIFQVVRSLPFQSRRGEFVTTKNEAKPKEIAQR